MIQIPFKGTAKMCRASASTVNGVATILLKIPGSPNLTETRIAEGGRGWFNSPIEGDYVKAFVTDEDNLLGYGAGATVGSYTDTAVPSDNQGFFICSHVKFVEMNKITNLGRLKSGLYLKIVATKGDLSSDTFRCNIYWADPEDI